MSIEPRLGLFHGLADGTRGADAEPSSRTARATTSLKTRARVVPEELAWDVVQHPGDRHIAGSAGLTEFPDHLREGRHLGRCRGIQDRTGCTVVNLADLKVKEPAASRLRAVAEVRLATGHASAGPFVR